MKVAIVVPGRWSAFALATALKARRHEVRVFTNYPPWLAKRFGLDASIVTSTAAHFFLSRASQALNRKVGLRVPERELAERFGSWAAKRLRGEEWDAVLVFSQVAEEVLTSLSGTRTVTIVNRENSHIRAQSEILLEEERRTGIRLARPSEWAIAREEREYALTKLVRVVAGYSRDTFIARGMPEARVWCHPSGAPVDAFQAPREVLEARVRRILSGAPLRVIFVGAKVLRKGLWDLLEVARRLRNDRFQFRVVGPDAPETASLLPHLRRFAELVPKQPERLLPAQYAWADLYLLPSLEEGFPQTTAQAWANGLPILTTPNAGGTEFVTDGRNGWILPIRSPDAFVDRLAWCDAHREDLAAIVSRPYELRPPRTWATVAAEFEQRLLAEGGDCTRGSCA